MLLIVTEEVTCHGNQCPFFSGPLCSSNDRILSAIDSFATGYNAWLFVCLPLPCLPPGVGFPPFPSATQPSVLLREDPPPYSPLTSPESGSAPVIHCRVCQNLISVEGKIHQHVVKCTICNEATVGFLRHMYGCMWPSPSGVSYRHYYMASLK